jgi:twitching motility protein PilT
MPRIDSFLRLVAEQSASDLHISAGVVPTIRHDGKLRKLPFRILSEMETSRLLLEILTPEQRQQLASDHEFDFVYPLPGVARFRASYAHQARGLTGVFRVISERIPSLDELRVPPAIRRLTELTNGLILVTGPTGAGKTTTLAAMINEINQTKARHIITVEDPIEFVHQPIRSLPTQRQVGRHVESFSAALRSALREAPDVLVIGELRDSETIQLALSAAETGVLVFGSLHTNTAATAVDRILDSSPEESREQVRGVLSVLLRAIVAQHLVKRARGEGRIAAFEILLQSYAVSHLIREGKIHQIDALLQSAEHAGSGMLSLDTCLYQFLVKGLIDLDDALSVAKDPEHLRKMASEIPDDA